jgi:hypothetical protein
MCYVFGDVCVVSLLNFLFKRVLVMENTLPVLLQSAINDVRLKFSVENEHEKKILIELRTRLNVELEIVSKSLYVRPKLEIMRKLALVDNAEDALKDDAARARMELDIQGFISRYTELEHQDLERKAENESRMRTSETRYLPMAPRTNVEVANLKKGQNYAQLIADEIRYKYGGQQRPVDLIKFDLCPNCMIAMKYNVALQQLICPVPSCGYWKRFADMTSAALAYGEEVEFCKYSYNPVTHLDDTIKYAEAGEAPVVPPQHLEKIMQVLVSNDVKPVNVTIKIIRDIIREIKGIHAENTVQIYSRLTGRSPRRLSTFAKDQIRIMFITEEPYYRKHCDGRTNNLSYPYKLYKYCELLGYWEMLETLPLLRGDNNLAKHDVIQARVHRDLDWQFIPTLKPKPGDKIEQVLRRTGISSAPGETTPSLQQTRIST